LGELWELENEGVGRRDSDRERRGNGKERSRELTWWRGTKHPSVSFKHTFLWLTGPKEKYLTS
jgi:hypothetical protein